MKTRPSGFYGLLLFFPPLAVGRLSSSSSSSSLIAIDPDRRRGREREHHQEAIFRGAQDREVFFNRLLGEHGIQKDSRWGRAEFEKRLELRRASEELEQLEEMVGGWCLGSEEFRDELLAQMHARKGAEHFGPEIRESTVQKADLLVKQE